MLLMRRGTAHTSIERIAYEIMTRGGRTRRPDAGVEGSPLLRRGKGRGGGRCVQMHCYWSRFIQFCLSWFSVSTSPATWTCMRSSITAVSSC